MQEALVRLRDNIARVYLGNPGAIDQVIRCLLSRGHLLVEDVPGVGKTVLATALARSVEGEFSRIQLTPDLLPSDILGVTIYNRDNHSFEFKKGPIFANIVLADEINRTPPRTQTALLEAMNEATVTVDGQVHRLLPPFMLIATQNPYDFEGTYPLPENQLDRFLMRISLGYPAREDEARVLEQRPADHALTELSPVLHAEEVVSLQREVDEVRLDRALVDYIIDLARASRDADEVQVGLSPRGSLALAQAARATAFLDSRDYVIPEDILDNVTPVCAHRIIPRPYASSNGHGGAIGAGGGGTDASAMVLQRLLATLPSPA